MIVLIVRYCKLELFNIAVKGQTRLSLSRNSLALAAAGDVTVRPARRRIRHVVYVNRDASEVPRSRLILGMQMSADKSRSLHPTPEAGASSVITSPVGAAFILLRGCVEKGG